MDVALIGTGLIGGSLGLALRSRGHRVVAYDLDAARLDRALALGIADSGAADLAAAVAGCDIVVVATPVGRVADAVVAALDAGAPVVTDVGSVKATVVESARRHGVRFVGGHPMA